jgi:hypothetical protein
VELVTERREGKEWVYKIHPDGSRELWQKRTIPPRNARGVSRSSARAASIAGGMAALRQSRAGVIAASERRRKAARSKRSPFDGGTHKPAAPTKAG